MSALKAFLKGLGTRNRYLINKRWFAKKSSPEISEEPIPFLKSNASKWTAEESRRGFKHGRLWYEPFVVLGSVSVFLIYFGYLREENDIDEELSRSLYSRIDGLEEQQLKTVIEYNDQKGLETQPYIDRLNQLRLEKNSTEQINEEEI